MPSCWTQAPVFSQALQPRHGRTSASTITTFSTETPGSDPIASRTQSRRVSELPCRRGEPANPRTVIGM